MALLAAMAAALVTVAPVAARGAGQACQDSGVEPALSAAPGPRIDAGPPGPVTLRVGEQSSATSQAALVVRPPAPGPAEATVVQPQVIYAPGATSGTKGRPVVRTLAAAEIAVPEYEALPAPPAAAAIAGPAPAIMRPQIVYAPGLGPPSPGRAGTAAPVDIRQLQLSAEDCDALARVAYAEAGNQGPDGLAAVAYTILNRVASGRFQSSVQAVIDSPGQFEPVARAGGWRRLPPLSPGLQAQFDLLLAAILSGQVADPTRGALYFQNRAVVAARAAAGLVPSSLIDFGGQPAIAEIRDHSFYGDPAGRVVGPASP